MKHRVLLATILLAVLSTSPTAWADENKTNSEATYELELSKSLTLNPSGQPAVPAKPKIETLPPEPSSNWLAWLLAAAGIVATGLAYRQGRQSQVHLSERQTQQLSKAHRDIAALKNSLVESGSGPRQEWQSSLTSMRNQIEEKNRHIDSLHDTVKRHTVEIKKTNDKIETHGSEVENLSEQHRNVISKIQHEQQQAIELLNEQHRQSLVTEAQAQEEQIKQAELALLASKKENDTLQDQHREALKIRDSQLLQQNEEREIQHRQQLADEAAALATTNSQLETLHAEFQQFKDNAERNAATAEGELDQLKISLRQAHNDKEDLELGTNKLQQKLDEQLGIYKETEQNFNELTHDRQSLLSQVEKFDLQNQEHQAQLVDRDQSIATLSAKVDALFEELTAVQTNYDEKIVEISEHEHSKNVFIQQIEKLEHDKQTLSEGASKKEELESTVSTLEAQLQSAIADHDAAKQTVAEIEQRVEERDNDLSTVVTELETFRAANAEMQQQLADAEDAESKAEALELLTGEHRLLEQHVVEQTKAIESETEAKAAIEEQLLELGVKLDVAKNETEDKATQVSKLRERLEAADRQKSDIDSQLEKTVDDLLEAKQLLDEKSEQIDKLQAQLEKTDQQKANVDAKLAKTGDELLEANQLLDDKAQQLQNTVHELAELKNITAAQQTDHEALSEKFEKLEEQHETVSDELLKVQDQLAHKTELLYARDGRLEEMVSENTQQADQVRKLKDEHIDFSDTVTKLEDQLSGAEKAQLELSGELQQQLDRANHETKSLTQKLEQTTSDKDDLARKIADLEERMIKTGKEVDEKNMRVLQLGTEVVEYKTKQEQYLQDIALMEDQLTDYQHAEKQNQPKSGNQDALKAAIRARDNIVDALENQARESALTINELEKQVENLQLSLAVGRQEQKTQPGKVNGKANATDEMVHQLRKSLAEKSHIITTLHTDLKVHKDLVKVFENDSIQLQKTEEDLETLAETKAFLERELTNAVNEVNTLKKRLSKANVVAERRKNIGRTPSQDTKQHQQLLYRLADLEAENKQQLELIQTLRTDDDLAS